VLALGDPDVGHAVEDALDADARLGAGQRRTDTGVDAESESEVMAAVGATEAKFSGTAHLKEVPKAETYSRNYAESNGFLTLLSDGERLVGAYGLGPQAGEWLQQATLAIRGRVPLDVLRDTIQPFPTFSEVYVAALKALRKEVVAGG